MKPYFFLSSLYFYYVLIWHGIDEVPDKEDEGLSEVEVQKIVVEVDLWGHSQSCNLPFGVLLCGLDFGKFIFIYWVSFIQFF